MAAFFKKFGPKASTTGEFLAALTFGSPYFFLFELWIVDLTFCFSVLGWRASRRARAPIPAFHQSSTATGSVLIVAADKPSQPTTSSQPQVLNSSSQPLAAQPVETPTSPMVHLIDESSPSDGDLVPYKRRIVDVGDGTTRAVGSSRDEHELTTVVLESDAIPPEMPLSVEVAERSPLPEGRDEIGGPSEAVDAVLVSKPSSSRLVGIPLSAEERAKDVVKDSYEIGFDIDPEEVRKYNEGFTLVEMRLDGSSRTIEIPIYHDLLINTEDVVPFLGPLCSNIEGTALATFNDATYRRA